MLEFWPKYPLPGTNDTPSDRPVQPLYRHIQVEGQCRQAELRVERVDHSIRLR